MLEPMPLASLVALFNELCDDGINYRLGEKDPNTGFLDCSGWIRYACERLAPTWEMPDGSYNQMDWCAWQQLRRKLSCTDQERGVTV